MDSGKVLKQSDDWKSKVDTNTKKPVEFAKTLPVARDSAMSSLISQSDSTSVPGALPVEGNAVAREADAVAAKDNNQVWKDYMEEFITALRTEVMPSKKVKAGTYSVLLEYEIGLEGQVTASNVSVSPENSFIADQVKQRITLTAPQLTPLLNNYGKPRKAIKKQTIALSK
jgi:hypothetical protein